jgi:hypothetical protein
MSTAPQTIRTAVVSSKPNLFRQPHFYFLIAFLIAVGGFWPSFFSKLSSTDTAHLIHGVTATLWMTIRLCSHGSSVEKDLSFTASWDG